MEPTNQGRQPKEFWSWANLGVSRASVVIFLSLILLGGVWKSCNSNLAKSARTRASFAAMERQIEHLANTEADLNAQVDRLQSEAKEQAQVSLALGAPPQFYCGTKQLAILPRSLGTGKSYTYIHINVNTHQIVYIGKGTDDRWIDPVRSDTRHESDILYGRIYSRLVLINASESEALAQEAWLINRFGSCNLYNRISGIGDPHNYLNTFESLRDQWGQWHWSHLDSPQ
jgi:cell division protein FtsB